MAKKKTPLYITLASIMILICCIGLGYLVIHFINVNNPNHTYIEQFNHKRYYFESSDNDAITNAFTSSGSQENFYIMSMGGMSMVSASKSQVISFEGSGTMTNFKQNKEQINLNNKMILTCGSDVKFTASTIQFLSKENKMQITFTKTADNSIAKATFAPK